MGVLHNPHEGVGNKRAINLGGLTMMERGEAYMQMEKMVAARPHKSLRFCPWRARRETRTTAEKANRTKARRTRIRLFSLLGAKRRKITTYTNSIAAPVPLMVVTNMLCGDTNGKPYLTYICRERD